MPIGVFPIEPVDVKASIPTTVTVDGGSLGVAGMPILFNVPMPTAGTEYSQMLPDSTKSFQLKARNRSVIQYAFVMGESGTNFIKIAAGGADGKDLLDINGLTLYFQSEANDEVMQITAWV